MTEPARLLVADDDQSVALTLQAILEQEGYHVSVAGHAREARRLFTTSWFDVALLDLRLDDADGIELLEELRARQPHCEAIMLTGYASLESAVRAIRHGAYDYLVKPCDLDELKLTIARALERGMMARTLRERLGELEQANATINALAADLQRRVDEATADLTRKVAELSEAKHSLEEVQRQRDQFVSMIAHELGQPLTSITGYAQMIARPNMPEETREKARLAILAQTRRLTRLVRDLSDVARLAAGSFRVAPAPVDLAELVREQAELAQANATDHTVKLEAPRGPVTVACDRDRIAQVLSNLLTNALTYTPAGTVRVRLAVEGDDVVVSVSDEGPGLPPDGLESIFDANVRLVGAGGDSGKGHGLGLYIARGIAEAHCGRLWAESTPGEGATFTLRLPLAPVPSPAAAEAIT